MALTPRCVGAREIRIVTNNTAFSTQRPARGVSLSVIFFSSESRLAVRGTRKIPFLNANHQPNGMGPAALFT